MQPLHLLVPRQVPESDGAIAAGRGQALAVGVEGHREDLVRAATLMETVSPVGPGPAGVVHQPRTPFPLPRFIRHLE
jgi:hypothetical protein